LAAIYFVVDAVFMTLARPIADWFARRLPLHDLRSWIRSLRPYPALALFAVPVMLLEPVKPVAAYMAATGHVVGGIALFIAGELLKLVLIDRLFCITRDKLMSIPAFAWAYGKFRLAKLWLESSEAWRAVRRLSKHAARAVSGYVAELKSYPTLRRAAWQHRWAGTKTR
jgi:hypothetical protein